METDDLHQQVISLLRRVPRAPERPFPGGASEAELLDLTRRLGVALPGDLASWLRVCKGEAIGPGGVFGTLPADESHDIAARSALFPTWRVRGWLPVAGDGCGNHYMLLTDGRLTGFVCFVEAVADPDRIDYVAASSLWRFLFFLFRAELGDRSWPFDADEVTAIDPRITEAPAALLPWEAGRRSEG
ncbi:MAG: SMI1/KNR4 family protein [Actinomadura sp.]